MGKGLGVGREGVKGVGCGSMGDGSLDFLLSLCWHGLGHSFYTVFCWNTAVIAYKFSVLLSCPFPGSLARESRL